MTPKEKAEELVDKYIQTNGNSFFAKQCALIAVNEIKQAIASPEYEYPNEKFDYWQQVEQEIQNL